MKSNFLLVLCCLVVFGLYGQSSDTRIAKSKTPLSAVARVVMPPLNNATLLQAEMARRGPGIAPRFAETMAVAISPQTHGTWETLPNGNELWRLQLSSKSALSLNLGFTQFHMPAGGSMILYSPDRKKVMGPFTPADNEEHEELWTPILEGDELVIEVQLPAEKRNELGLFLSSVNHDFLGFSQLASGSCNLDVICGAADGWGIVDRYRDIIQSVAVYGFNGGTFCTGFLINNTRNDCTPYFMTANHCGINTNNAASLVVYWNFQNSTCRQPGTPQSGGPGNGNLNDFNSGAIRRAGYAASDMTLVELDDPISPTANAFFAGWTIANTTPQDSVICIHHPSTDEKRISFEFQPTYRGSWGSGATMVPNGNHVIVPDWDIGTTEGGSSGAPLFDRNKRVVGQLHGGGASCGNDAYDSYGWFTTSWEGGGAVNNRLKDWLDPDNTGVMAINGRSQMMCSFFVESDVLQQEICAPQAAVFNLNISMNYADDVDLTVTGLPTGLTAMFSANPVAPGGTSVLTLGNTNAVAPGTYTLVIEGSDGANSASTQITITIAGGVPAAPALTTPANNAQGVFPINSFVWEQVTGNITYEIQVATDAAFTQIVLQSSLANTTTIGATLESETIYFWRVRANSICGIGNWSSVFTFETAAVVCGEPVVSTQSVAIPSQGTPTITSTIDIQTPGDIASIRLLNLDISHSWPGDVSAALTSPEGVTVLLFDRPGVPGSDFGCDGADIMVNLYDAASGTADALEGSCNANAPSIGGDFMPLESFASFLGTSAAGTWTLTVSDAVNQDGGTLNGWSLEICTILPNQAALYLDQTDYDLCADAPLEIDFLLGTGFSNSVVTLSASDVPAGANISFNPNPAAPGDMVTATISGLSQAGTYTPSITATGGQSASITLSLNVDSAPEMVTLISPAADVNNVPLSPTFSWNASSGAIAYIITVAADPDFLFEVWTDAVTGTTASTSGLDYATFYYWRVDALNDCGLTEGSVRSFVTVQDFTFSAGPGAIEACISDEVTIELYAASGFLSPATISYTVTPNATLNVSYDIDPADVPMGSSFFATLPNLAGLTAGNIYTLTFTLSDGVNTRMANVQLLPQGPPALPALSSPANGASIVTSTPTFSWQAAAGSSSYLVEIARDALFLDLVNSQEVSGTNYTAPALPEGGLYYWRVTALNDCGGSTAAGRNFNYVPNGVEDVEAARLVVIAPNPTKGNISVQFPETWGGEMVLELYAANGQRLQRQLLEQVPATMSVDLSTYPSGVYWLHIVHDKYAFSKKIVRQ